MPAAHPVAERLQGGGGATLVGWLRPFFRLQARLENLTVWEKVLVKPSRKGSKTPTGRPPGARATGHAM